MVTKIAILNQKGGSGKTTLSTNLALALVRDNYRVLLIDSDPQGSLRDWNEANDAELIPVIGLDRETLPKDLKAVCTGYDFVVIDGAPQIAKMSAAAVKAADLVLIPVQPSPYDIWACADLVDIILARQSVTNGLPLSYFVVSRAIKNTKLSEELLTALSGYELPVFKSRTTQRVAYPTTASLGLTVFQEPLSQASCEILAIKNEVLEVLEYGTTT